MGLFSFKKFCELAADQAGIPKSLSRAVTDKIMHDPDEEEEPIETEGEEVREESKTNGNE